MGEVLKDFPAKFACLSFEFIYFAFKLAQIGFAMPIIIQFSSFVFNLGFWSKGFLDLSFNLETAQLAFKLIFTCRRVIFIIQINTCHSYS